MSVFGVNPGKEAALRGRMAGCGILESDLEESFVRSRGPGGQNVNKVSTCVRLRHLPTGITVRVDKDRSRGVNRFLARRELLSRYEETVLGKKPEKEILREKIRKQKKRRARRAGAKTSPPGPGTDGNS
ncbi:MAG TPA: peptide chain release factor-like protein [Thermodesulfobacteriota bacterium]|nr:peptide chain release factor-like protein [Thermodesulfobacteriota bacterium]